MIRSWFWLLEYKLCNWKDCLIYVYAHLYNFCCRIVSKEIFVEGMSKYKALPVLKNVSLSGHCFVLRMSEECDIIVVSFWRRIKSSVTLKILVFITHKLKNNEYICGYC